MLAAVKCTKNNMFYDEDPKRIKIKIVMCAYTIPKRLPIVYIIL